MHPLVKARHPRRWTTHLWNPDDQDSGVQVDMHHASALGLRLERAPGAEVQILGKKIEPFWSFLDALNQKRDNDCCALEHHRRRDEEFSS